MSYIGDSLFSNIEQSNLFQAMFVLCLTTKHSFIFVNNSKCSSEGRLTLYITKDVVIYVSLISHLILTNSSPRVFVSTGFIIRRKKQYHNLRVLQHLLTVRSGKVWRRIESYHSYVLCSKLTMKNGFGKL
jgi:hypothetical protein